MVHRTRHFTLGPHLIFPLPIFMYSVFPIRVEEWGAAQQDLGPFLLTNGCSRSGKFLSFRACHTGMLNQGARRNTVGVRPRRASPGTMSRVRRERRILDFLPPGSSSKGLNKWHPLKWRLLPGKRQEQPRNLTQCLLFPPHLLCHSPNSKFKNVSFSLCPTHFFSFILHCLQILCYRQLHLLTYF